MAYGLYQTLRINLPEEEFDKCYELSKKLNGIKGKEAKAVFLLIWEHAKTTSESDDFLNNNYNLSSKPLKDRIKLPYKGVLMEKKNDNDLKFDVEELPTELRWILWKFSNILEK